MVSLDRSFQSPSSIRSFMCTMVGVDIDLHGTELSVDLIGWVGVAWSTIKMLDCLFVLRYSWLACIECNSGWERLHLRNQCGSHESAFHSPKLSTPVSLQYSIGHACLHHYNICTTSHTNGRPSQS